MARQYAGGPAAPLDEEVGIPHYYERVPGARHRHVHHVRAGVEEGVARMPAAADGREEDDVTLSLSASLSQPFNRAIILSGKKLPAELVWKGVISWPNTTQ